MTTIRLMQLTGALGFAVVLLLLTWGCASETSAPYGDECSREPVYLRGTSLALAYVWDCETRSIYRELDKFNSRPFLECNAAGQCSVMSVNPPQRKEAPK